MKTLVPEGYIHKSHIQTFSIIYECMKPSLQQPFHMERRKTYQPSMTVTVGICAHNEGSNIGPLLKNILWKQELSPLSEIIVVCSGCVDNTLDIVKEYAKKDKRIKLLVERQRQGKASAVNQILTKAKGDAILFISADTIPKEKCFSQLISRFDNSKVGVVCGRPVPINNSTSFTGRIVQILWGIHDYIFKQLDDTGLARHASEAFCIRRGITDTIPLNIVNDDSYLALTARAKGWKIEYEPKSRISICGPKTLLDYIKQRRRVIYGHHQTRRLTAETPQYFVLATGTRSFATKFIHWVFTKYDVFSIMLFFYIELMLNFLAVFDLFQKKSHHKWSVATSTKKVEI